ncbi:MAG: NUDIX domain-containing protein [Candidatus Eisenbacteria bacterium]
MPLRPPEFRFCLACGGPLSPGGLCPKCGESRVPRPTPAVAVAVVEASQVLLVKRRYAPMVGYWALPAGYLEGHEDPWRTARREAREETGLEIRPTRLMGAFPGGGQDGPVVLLVFSGTVEGGRLEAGDDASEAGFFPLTRLPTPLAWGPHRIVLASLLQQHGLPVPPALLGPAHGR